MTDWGIPDWRDTSAYGPTREWSVSRWHWEFIRRREDCRQDFITHAEDTYRWKKEFADQVARAQRGDTTNLHPSLALHIYSVAHRYNEIGTLFQERQPS